MNFISHIKLSPILMKISDVSNKLGLETYIIGGYVRDLLLNIPSKDIDIVCIGDGLELAKKVSETLDGNPVVTLYKRFGTAQIKYGNYEIEFVGARKESYSKDSRKPTVEDGSLEDDQLRRDFTINALAISLNRKTFGKLLDPFKGLEALEQKIIKTPLDPDKTFYDDPLRMIRAIRFATKLNFTIDNDVFMSIKKNVERLDIISQERIIIELNLILGYDRPSSGILLLHTSGLLEKILPELCRLEGKEIKEGFSHKDNFYHTLKVIDNVSKKSKNLWLRWAAVLHDIAKPLTKKFNKETGFSFHGHEELGARMTPKICRRLKLPLGKEMLYVKKLVKLHLRPISLVNEIVTDSAVRRLIYEAGDDIDDLMLLCRSDITTENKELAKKYFNNLSKVEAKIRQVEETDQIKNFKPCITGEIIMGYFNIKPTKMVGIIKENIKEAILEGKIKNIYEEAFPYMQEVGKEVLKNL